MALTPEQLINDLQKEVFKLKEELEEAHKDIKDFEILAIEWRKGYKKLEMKHSIEIMELKQTIEELEKELKYSKP
jgi:dsDNA-specific endonuclease/ATPase MutS2